MGIISWFLTKHQSDKGQQVGQKEEMQHDAPLEDPGRTSLRLINVFFCRNIWQLVGPSTSLRWIRLRVIQHQSAPASACIISTAQVNSPSPQPPLLNVARFVFGVAGTGDTMRSVAEKKADGGEGGEWWSCAASCLYI